MEVKALLLVTLILLTIGCKPKPEKSLLLPQPIKSNPFDIGSELNKDSVEKDEMISIEQEPKSISVPLPPEWVDLQGVNSRIALDLKYATTDNFVETKLYPCPRCLLRPEVAEALNQIQILLDQENLRLKMFDCYRPKPIQEKLWEKVPDARYVTNPSRGSMHNRGAAVDLTIIDSTGRELDMGTPFDFFGERAYHTSEDHREEVLANRRKLMRLMHQAGFRHIRTEWWHYSYTLVQYELSDYVWPCE